MKAAYKKYNLSIPEMADEGYARPCATFTRHPKPSVSSLLFFITLGLELSDTNVCEP